VSDQKPVVILGAGLAGLTAATFLQRQGVPVRVFEASPHLAGLARSFHDADGFTYDFGAHFITNRLAEAVGIGAQCRDVPCYGESVWLGGRAYGYPFGLMRKFRLLRSGAAAQLRALFRRPTVTSAADWFRSKYGRALADEVAIPLTEAWSGAPAEELASSVGDSIPGSILRTLYLKYAGRLLRRTVAIGYSREMPENPHVWHVYPEGGLSTLCQHLAEEVKENIATQSPVEAILTENGRVTSVVVKGREQPASAVVSTAPWHVLARLVRGTDALGYLARFRYRPMIFVNLRLKGRRLLPDVVTWTPEKTYPFFRLTETAWSMPWLAPEGHTLITADIGCEVNDAMWKTPDDKLGELCLDGLARLIPSIRHRYMGCRVLRTPLAYPIFLREYEQDRLRFHQSSGIAGLYSVGRNGEFSHFFMEDVYWRTRRKMGELLGELRGQTSHAAPLVTELAASSV
jgi:protoporphyrinogen oxidase